MSKFYIKTNKVIENIHDICAKKDLNQYVKGVINNKEKTPYQGTYIRRVSERENKENMAEMKTLPTKTEKEIKEEEPDPRAEVKLLEAAKIERIRKNCALILHERNVYAFLGHIAEDLIETHYNTYYQCLSFLLVKKVITRLTNLTQALRKKEMKGIDNWEEL